MIRALEGVSLKAWPALETQEHDGWLLRFANGYTRRANSVHPLHAPRGGLAETVAYCEKAYRDRGLRVVFKMTSASSPVTLDSFLEDHGYQVEARTSVQRLELGAALDASPMEIGERLTDGWFEAFARLAGLDSAQQDTARRLLAAIVPKTAFAAIREHGIIVACGLGVVDGPYVGLFDLVTGVAHRRKGCAQGLVGGIANWGKKLGARTAYLQVMHDNAPAMALYRKMRFHEEYSYWYRVKV